MRRFGALGIVMIGLWSLVGTIGLIGGIFSMLTDRGSPDRLLLALNLFSLLVSVVVGVALIMGRDRLASRWFDDTEVGVSVESLDLLRIGLVLTGLFLMIDGVQSTFFSLVNGIVQARTLASMVEDMDRLQLWGPALSSSAFGLVRLLVGWLVIYYSARLAVFLWGLSPRQRVPAASVATPVSVTMCPACGVGYDPADYIEGVERRCVECHSPLDGDDA